MKLLLKYGADINHQGTAEFTALSYAFLLEQQEIITFLLAQPNLEFGPHDHSMFARFKEAQEQQHEQ